MVTIERTEIFSIHTYTHTLAQHTNRFRAIEWHKSSTGFQDVPFNGRICWFRSSGGSRLVWEEGQCPPDSNPGWDSSHVCWLIFSPTLNSLRIQRMFPATLRSALNRSQAFSLLKELNQIKCENGHSNKSHRLEFMPQPGVATYGQPLEKM